MNNILIPTDFSAASLQMVAKTAETLAGPKFNVLLFHAFEMPDSIPGLLFHRREISYGNLITDQFRNQCRKIKNLYFDRIGTISTRCMFGSTVAVFRNFAEANDVDLIVLSENVQLQMPHKHSIDPVVILRKSGIEIFDPFAVARAKRTTNAAMPALETARFSDV